MGFLFGWVLIGLLAISLCGCETMNIGGGLNPDEGRASLTEVKVSPAESVTFEAGRRARITVDYSAGIAPLTITLSFSPGVTPRTQTITIGEARPLGPAYWTVAAGSSTTEVQLDSSSTDRLVTMDVSLSDGLFANAWQSPASTGFFV
jgi:hypothetical protein